MKLSKSKDEDYLILTILIGGIFTSLATSTINIAIPELMHYFNADLETTRWALTGFMLATGIIAPVSCFLGEKFSYKRVYLTSIVGFTISSYACSISVNIQMLVAFRILQGVFNGLAMPSAMSLIYQVIPKKKQAFAISLWTFSLSFAPAIGPTISGALIQTFSWKAIFYMNLPIGVIVTLFILRFVPFYKLNPPKGFDSKGFFSSLTATTFLLIGFSNVSIWGWGSIKTVLFIILGVIIFIYFIYREKNTSNPVLDLNVFKSRDFTVSIIIRGVVTMALYAGSLLTPLFLQNAQHSTALEAGLVLLPASMVMAATSLIIGKVYNRISPPTVIKYGIISVAIGSFLLARTQINTSHTYIIFSMMFRNIGISASMSLATMYGMSSLAKHISGNGSSINNWISQSIGCFSISIFSSVLGSRTEFYQNRIQDITPILAYVKSIDFIYLISFFILILALGLSFLFKTNKKMESEIISKRA